MDDKKDTDRSPESKKRKLVEEIVAPMNLKRELFKDDEGYQTYLQCFGELKGSIKIVAANNINLELKADEAIVRLERSETEKDGDNFLRYCNICRCRFDDLEAYVYGTKRKYKRTDPEYFHYNEVDINYFAEVNDQKEEECRQRWAHIFTLNKLPDDLNAVISKIPREQIENGELQLGT